MPEPIEELLRRRNEKQRRKVSEKTKDKLLVGTHFHCSLCLKQVDVLEIHHIVPISKGGANTEDNLIVLCPTCHSKVHLTPQYTPKRLKMLKEKMIGTYGQEIVEEWTRKACQEQRVNITGSQDVTVIQAKGDVIISSPPTPKKPKTELLKKLAEEYEKRLKENL